MSEYRTTVVVDGYDVECEYETIHYEWPYYEVNIFRMDNKQYHEFPESTLRDVREQIKNGISDLAYEN